MWINTKTMIGITQANKDLNSVLDLVLKYGSAVILKNNKPQYIVVDVSMLESNITIGDIPSISIRDASRNFSKLTYMVYNDGYVLLTKRNTPVCVFCDFRTFNMLTTQKVQKD